MCGIVGFAGKRSDFPRETVLQNMMKKMEHRGPDQRGSYLDEDVALGFQRLSIIDLDHGSQPMFNETGDIAIVFNGEIYNYQAIREELLQKGHIFANEADTECLIHAYEEYGAEMLDKVRGMFAFAIWDAKKKTLFAARDFFGIKPFYYSIIKNQLVFGSEIKSILEHPFYEKKLNEEALEQYLSFQYSVMDETFFQGIFRLQPGFCMTVTWEDGRIHVNRKQFWKPKLTPDKSRLEVETLQEMEAVLKESVKMHMISDVEVGSLLSSGVDSSYLSTESACHKTFTVGFEEGNGRYNEISYAQELSKVIGKQNYSKTINGEDYWNSIPKVMYHMDEPLSDPAAVALYFVDQLAAEHVKVVLSGEGADELFGGYNIYHEPFSLRPFAFVPKGMKRMISAMIQRIPFDFKGKNYLIRANTPIENRFIGNANIFSVKERELLLRNPVSKQTPYDLTRSVYEKNKHLDDTAKMQSVDLQFWLPGDILLKADKMSMAHSLESRVPYLDKEVFAFAATLPLGLKIKDHTTKYLFRQLAKRILPEQTASKKKLGFPVPIREWLKEDRYSEKVKSTFEGEAAKQYFHTENLVALLEEHNAGKKDNSRKIWTVYTFLIWYQVFFAPVQSGV